jgi:4-hydroxy-tetrahydrodipicolinate synthase
MIYLRKKAMVKYKGVFTVLVTPFDANGKLDEEGLRQNIHYQLKSSVDGLVALGTTGEDPTLTDTERKRVVNIVVEEVKGQVPVMVGTGSYSTEKTIELTRMAYENGADAALIVTPYYNRPTQEGFYRHFKAVVDAVPLPVIIYNIQGRTGQNLQTDTLQRIVQMPTIVGVKEASGNLVQIGEVIEMARRERPDFSILSGDDGLTFGVMTLGGHGILSVASNLIPNEIKALVRALERHDLEAARNKHYELLPLFRGIFIETNPMPIKAAMEFWGMSAGGCRLPLCDLLPENQIKLQNVLKGYAKYKPQAVQEHSCALC